MDISKVWVSTKPLLLCWHVILMLIISSDDSNVSNHPVLNIHITGGQLQVGLVRTSGGDQGEDETCGTELAIFKSQSNIETCVSELDIS